MKSIKQQISELDQIEWDYYSEIENRELQNPFTSRLSHKQFVKDYFKRSGKNSVLNFLNYLPNKDLNNNRTKHTNSIFFLGVLIYNKTNLHSDFFENLNTAEYRRFTFLWFLSCLFHDFGFELENDKKAIIGINSLEDLKKKYSIENCLLETQPKEISNVLFSVIDHYFKYRLFEGNKIDHGIFAGVYLYDRLIKNRRKKNLSKNATLFWGKELDEQYAQVGTAIAVHNIWLPKKKDVNLYKKYNLGSLTNDFKPIQFKDFPLLYILGIVDTIDPMKTYLCEDFRPKEILESIDLKLNGNKVTFRNGKKSKLDFTQMTKNAAGINNWLDVGVDYNEFELNLTLR
ncbi:hypothetical protein [Flagellimonas sp. GZD32]|uniref:hypothetical protein n=1 Tax=Flagellimonas cixiensis TaxID=3228750 RepID=UPI0035C889E4